ncbi:hypothetical protein OCU04_011435 [Sclerotinia nivalis]|uniref:2EXR domain-containing protein n=1 Tax=Sclerotinia nivalis TaxID=352851 RepID=A0A9X0ABG9_9HELO|nr:hypothetical protein OCU04_011435 [Sclerotinia nivalis]
MAVVTLDRFTCFPQLPPELQMVIWSFCPLVGKQTIYVAESEETNIRRFRTRDPTVPAPKLLAEAFPSESFISIKYVVPSPLKICRSSRKKALQRYRRVPTTYGDTKGGSAPFYINSEQHSILFNVAGKIYISRPALYFWSLDGITFSTPNGESLCTSLATPSPSIHQWPSVQDALYILSRFPDIEHLYFLYCPSGPFHSESHRNRYVQWMSQEELKTVVKKKAKILLESGIRPNSDWVGGRFDGYEGMQRYM